MLKFFRRYMPYILAVIVAVLMVAFLIQPTLSIFMPSPGDEPVGHLDGQELTRVELQRAAFELDALSSLSQSMAMPLLEPPGIDEPLQWLLAMKEARSLGVSASQYEVELLLAHIDRFHAKEGLGRVRVAELAKRYRVAAAVVAQVVRQRLVYQKYLGLVSGLDYPSLIEQMDFYKLATQMAAAGYSEGVMHAVLSMQGLPRLSDPLRRRLILDQRSTAQIRAVVVDCDRYLHRVEGDPTQEQLRALFEQYKDDLPGAGRPDGLGYRYPDRVKIEYLTVPFDRVLAHFPADAIDEADAMDYYDQHPQEFQAAPEPTPDDEPAANPDPPIQPYAQVRDQIKQRLRRQRANELSNREVKAAQSLLLDEARGLESVNGYYVVPPGWKPKSFDEVADELERQHGLRPEVHTIDNRWLTAADLVALPRIGRSVLVGRRPVPFLQYVGSAKEFASAQRKNPLMSLRLQAMIPSSVLESPQHRDRHLFRLLEVQPSHTPDSWQQVRDQLTRDARRLAAYERLKQDTSMWADRAHNEGLDGLAGALESSVIRPRPFARRQPRGQGMAFVLDTPLVEGIGRNEVLVESVFELADRVLEAGGVDQTPREQTVTAVALDAAQKLVLVELEAVSPLTQKAFNAMKPSVDGWIGQALKAQDATSPVAMQALTDRMGFEPPGGDSVPEGEDHEQPPVEGA